MDEINTFYGVYLNDNKEFRIIELEKRYSTIYSRDTLGSFRIPRYEDEFFNFVDTRELIKLFSSVDMSNILKIDFRK